MEFEKIEEDDKKLKFVTKDTNPAMMNALRRISMNYIPVLAIEDVGVKENSSPIFDEVIAQRLGQVPLVFDPDKFTLKGECDCEDGCPNCEVDFTFEGEGLGRLYSKDLVCETGDIEVLYDEIPITEMDENQRVELEATAVLSKGKDHSKHQAAISSYQYYPIIDIDNDELTKEEKGRCVEVCPKDVFELDGGDLKVSEEKKCTVCKECVNEVDTGVVVTGDEEKFIFTIESTCSLSPQEIIEKAADILEKKSEKVVEKLS
ncbi:MAG: DNA-directed RNA polymerase subunit D [Candidatus Aenigmatarchaeota archaeon]